MVIDQYPIQLPPGSLVIVGPNGQFYLNPNNEGRPALIITGCTFVHQSALTPAQLAVVVENFAAEGVTLPQLHAPTIPKQGPAKPEPFAVRLRKALAVLMGRDRT